MQLHVAPCVHFSAPCTSRSSRHRVQEMKCRLGCLYGLQRFHHTERGFITSLLIKEAYKPADLLPQYLRMFSAAQLGKIPE